MTAKQALLDLIERMNEEYYALGQQDVLTEKKPEPKSELEEHVKKAQGKDNFHEWQRAHDCLMLEEVDRRIAKLKAEIMEAAGNGNYISANKFIEKLEGKK